MEKRKIKVLGMADTRTKKKGTKKVHSDYVYIWSGVDQKEYAKHGVGFLLHPETAKNLLDTQQISERIILIKLRQNQSVINYVQIYAPCNDSYSDEEKDKFFETVSDTINNIPDNEELMIMGDFNGKVGQRRDPWTKHLGPFSDNTATCNYNGNLILELCAEHELVIANTLFRHRQSQIITWYKWNNLDVCSQIDFVLVRTKMRSTLRDTRVIPNAELDTDHRPIITIRTQKQNTSDKNKAKANKTSRKRVINMKKLRSDVAQTKTNILVNEKLKSVDTKDMKVNDLWNTFKTAVTDSMKEACGTKKQGGPTRKLTAWWNEEIKEVIQTKKKFFKKWVKSKSEEDFIQYRLARRDAKRKTRLSKEASWKKYGEDLSALCQTSTRDFYKSVKAMRVRDNPFDPTTVVNDTKGQPLYEDDLIRGRWEEYFYDLLNPAGILDTGEGFIPSQPDHQEPNILESEVRWAVKDSPKDKAAGDDGITTRAVLACKEIGIQWLTLMFQRAWEERKVPDDWQRAVVVPIWKCKGNKKDCSTYRGISLLSHVGKMFAKILERRIRTKAEHLLSNSQFGFRKGRGCTDAIFCPETAM